MKLHRVQRPIENPYDYESVLEFFEKQCRLEIVDIVILLNDQLIQIEKDEDIKKMRKLHEVYKSLVYASVCRMFYKILSDKVPKDKLKEKALLFIKDVKSEWIWIMSISYSNVFQSSIHCDFWIWSREMIAILIKTLSTSTDKLQELKVKVTIVLFCFSQS